MSRFQVLAIVGLLFAQVFCSGQPESQAFDKERNQQRIDWLLSVVAACYEDLCANTGICQGKLEPMAFFNADMPVVEQGSGCFPPSLNETRCLKDLAIGVWGLVEPFVFLNEHFGEYVEHVGAMHMLARAIAWDMRDHANRDLYEPFELPVPKPKMLPLLRRLTTWNKHIAAFNILRRIERFANDANRALSYMGGTDVATPARPTPPSLV
ncbi:RF2 [Retroperitoneal fibromatosis-associated herpesvirus]|uniref:Interleukin 6 n=1 Tax=Retroperitoneal fibromatosis-associated herpesvirus TaxID=111469 RepID=A9JPH4_9GAMA|nr:RF2 [Retroperitoneal fibromatosis-associated herpesvirus]ABX74964.1 interleukin 6 [Retroperitoneal fibromatosis-associated herpesvirus]AGY30690.1 RF2 [Retroperitoneal fibromatosis-associated herpesvirus]